MTDLKYNVFWNETLSGFKNELGEDEYGNWFEKLEYIREGESEVFISVPSNFFLEMFKQTYLNKTTEKLSDLAGKSIKINLEASNKEKNPAKTVQRQEEKKEKPLEKTSNTPLRAQDSRKINPQLQEEYTFDTYVVGEVNNYAYNAALVVSKNPGTSKIYNPLLIYGGTGLGKTHLMQAIGHYVHQNSDLKILYITGNGFLGEFVEVMKMGPKDKDAFTKKYRNVDILLIDDIHTIEKGIGTQDELFYIFEALYNKKKQMVFTCDRPIAELKGMAPRLKSRFQWGQNIELHLPKYEELFAILMKKKELKMAELKKEIDISDDVIDLIIKNISSNIRDMEGALNDLIGYADLINKPVTMEIAQRMLKNKFADPKQGNMSIDIIQRVVAEAYNLTPNDLKGKKRTQAIIKARHMAIYLSRELTENSLTEIGQCFGDRDHSTIIHSHRTIEEGSRSDHNTYANVERLKRMIIEYNVK